MGLNPNYEFNIATEIPTGLEANFNENIALLMEQAKKDRPDLIASEAQLAKSKANLAVQKASSLPNITMSASLAHTGVVSGNGNDTDNSAIGTTLHIPFFTGFNSSYKINAARAEINLQNAKYNATQNSVMLDVWRSYNNFQTAKNTLSMVDTLLASAKKSEQVALGRYKAGAGSITDLLNAQSQLADARRQHVQSRYNWLIAKADLLRALGMLDKKTIKE